MKQFIVTVGEDEISTFMGALGQLGVNQPTKLHTDGGFTVLFRASEHQTRLILRRIRDSHNTLIVREVNVLDLEISHPNQPVESDGSSGIFQRKSRMLVEAIYARVISGTHITFDYLTFLIAGSIIAGAGLATNNAVVVVASMLVSPLMGPILGFTLGMLQLDYRLILRSQLNELIAVSISVLLGALFGLVFAPLGERFGWPTFEMASRGQPAGLVIGVVVAAASGAATAVAITVNNIASLVGVAISASLLPPAVNTGMAFSYAFVGPVLFGADRVSRSGMLKISGISFALLVINIVLIKITAYIFFRLKAVNRKSAFVWRELPKPVSEDVRNTLWTITGRQDAGPIHHTVTELMSAGVYMDALVASSEEPDQDDALTSPVGPGGVV